jgi:hypothetical protein
VKASEEPDSGPSLTPASEPAPSQRPPSARRSTPMPDFLDEMPGSYLAELGTTGWSIVAGALILISTVAVGCGALWAHVDATSTWFVTLRLAWIALGTSALILLVLTLWQLGTAYTEKRPLWILLSLSLAAASLATWGWFSYHAGVLPAPAREAPHPAAEKK